MRIRAYDWASTPLGPIDAWPQSLKTATGLLIASPVPIVMLWGEPGVMLYNDAYSVFAGGRHPQLLGSNVREGWPEVADFNDNVMKVGLAGGTLAYKDQELTLYRTGQPEQVWMNLDYWPVPGEDGRPAGVIATVVETTEKVRADRLRAETNERLELALSAGRGIGTWDWDISADRVVADERFAELYGVDPAVARDGAPLSAFFKGIHPDDAERVGEEVERAIQTRAPFRSEYRLVQPDGEIRWVSAEGRIITNADGKALRFPGVTFDITDRRATDAALAETETRYDTLFGATNTGFCIIQMKFDADMRPVDYMIVEGNPAFAEMTGLQNANGKWVSEIAPGLEQHWFDLYGQVALTGKTARFENPADVFGRWYDVEALRIGDPALHRVAILFTNITERKQIEARQAALLELTDTLRDLTDAEEIAQASSAILARALNVTRAGYGVMNLAAETVTIARDYNAAGMSSIAGTLKFRDFGSYIDDLARGETVVVTDTTADARTADTAEALAGIGVSSFINMPLTEQGRVVALVFVNNVTPRRWSDSDVELLREVAARVRIAIERARAAADLEDSEARYRTLFDTMDEGFCIIEFFDGPHGPDSDYIHVEANPAYAAQAGIDHVVGKKLREMVGDEADAWVARYGAVLKTGVPIRFEQELEATGRWLELSAFRVEPPERRQVAVLFQDLTERRKAEVALRTSEASLRQQGEELARLNGQLEILLAGSKAERDRLWLLSQDMLARADYGGGMSAVNPAWTRILGWSEHELLTNPYADIIDPENLPATVAALEEMQRTGLPTRFENRILTRDNVWTPIGWTVAPEPDGINFIAVGRDLTEDKAREQQLLAAQEALRQSQKMEAVGQLTGGIAHDFNNLLAGISGSLELLGKRLGEGRLNGMERYIDAAQGSAQRAASLTQRLLAFSRRQTLDPRPTDVNRLIGGMEDLIRRTVGPDVEVEVVGAGGLWTTRIDASQLENALLNLCINGRDAMAPDGGRLTIETANKWLDDRAARHRDLLPGQYVSLCVTDTGTGMTPEVQAQVFDPFFTTKPLGQGTGLGLSMIHGFVRQSGGQVRIYSELGKGTTMCLYLPRYTGELETPDEDSLPPVVHGGHGETVMVIDDEETVRMLVAEVLGDAGYHVLEAPDGPSGLEILRSDARIDLLITDVGLPGGMNGRQVADAAREVRPDLKVLFVTGYAENAAVGNGHLDPGMEVMTKPFVMAALGDKVREMIER
nr:PAS domain S-box protein [Brevundimonas goettingensis]